MSVGQLGAVDPALTCRFIGLAPTPHVQLVWEAASRRCLGGEAMAPGGVWVSSLSDQGLEARSLCDNAPRVVPIPRRRRRSPATKAADRTVPGSWRPGSEQCLACCEAQSPPCMMQRRGGGRDVELQSTPQPSGQSRVRSGVLPLWLAYSQWAGTWPGWHEQARIRPSARQSLPGKLTPCSMGQSSVEGIPGQFA